MELLLLALAPGLVIAFYIYVRDKYEREPFKHVALTFFIGIIAALIAALIESAFPYNEKTATALATAANATLVVGPIEEIAKFLVVWLFMYRSPEFDEPFDGVVYCVMASMGFATIENIAYVFDGGMHVGIERALFSVPGHAAYAAIMGYYMGRAKFDTSGRSRALLATGLILAIVAHGLYDFGLMLHSGAGLIITLITFIFAVTYALRAIRESSRLSGAFWAARQTEKV
jgi:RsiW-degrading membrane proteinase PrsW (M82 family)